MILIPRRLIGHISDNLKGQKFDLSNRFQDRTWLEETQLDKTQYYLLWNYSFCFGVMLLDHWRR